MKLISVLHQEHKDRTYDDKLCAAFQAKYLVCTLYIFGCCLNISYLQNVYSVGSNQYFFASFFSFFNFDQIWICINHSIIQIQIQKNFENLNCINFKFPQYFEYFLIHFATSIPNVPTAEKLMKKNQTYCII